MALAEPWSRRRYAQDETSPLHCGVGWLLRSLSLSESSVQFLLVGTAGNRVPLFKVKKIKTFIFVFILCAQMHWIYCIFLTENYIQQRNFYSQDDEVWVKTFFNMISFLLHTGIASRLTVAKIKSVVSVLFRLISESLSIGKQWGYRNFWTSESMQKLASLSPWVGLVLHFIEDRPNFINQKQTFFLFIYSKSF